MTVKELIEKLNQFNPQDEIGVSVRKIGIKADTEYVSDKTKIVVEKHNDGDIRYVSVWIKGEYEE